MVRWLSVFLRYAAWKLGINWTTDVYNGEAEHIITSAVYKTDSDVCGKSVNN
jgi:hypothetical protein